VAQGSGFGSFGFCVVSMKKFGVWSALEIAAEQEKMLKVESPILHLGFLDNISILNTMF